MLKENFSHVYDKFKLLLYDKAFNDGDEDALSAFEVICMEIITALKEPTVNAFISTRNAVKPIAGSTTSRRPKSTPKTTVWSTTISGLCVIESKRDSRKKM